MTTYRLQALDDNGSVIESIPAEIGTIDGTIVFQLELGRAVAPKYRARLIDALRDAFPDRRVLVMEPGIRFVYPSLTNERHYAGMDYDSGMEAQQRKEQRELSSRYLVSRLFGG